MISRVVSLRRPLPVLCLVPLVAFRVAAQADGDAKPSASDRVALLRGASNPKARFQDDRGPVDSRKKLSQMTLLFRRTPAQQVALDRLLEELQDPSSTNFHKWLPPEEFGERFG